VKLSCHSQTKLGWCYGHVNGTCKI
jgi:hypothetical protein